MVERVDKTLHSTIYQILRDAEKEQREGHYKISVNSMHLDRWEGGAVVRNIKPHLLFTSDVADKLKAAGVESSLIVQDKYGSQGIELSNLRTMMGEESASRIERFARNAQSASAYRDL